MLYIKLQSALGKSVNQLLRHCLDTDKSKTYRAYIKMGRPGSVIGIATAYVLDGPGIESQWGRDFSHLSRQDLRSTQPPVKWVRGVAGA
jgi:hypothetical protein